MEGMPATFLEKSKKTCLAQKVTFGLSFLLQFPMLFNRVAQYFLNTIWSYFSVLFPSEVYIPCFGYDWHHGYRGDLFFPEGATPVNLNRAYIMYVLFFTSNRLVFQLLIFHFMVGHFCSILRRVLFCHIFDVNKYPL